MRFARISPLPASFLSASRWILIPLLLAVTAPGCGDDTEVSVVVDVEPATAMLQVGQSRQFAATVTGAEDAAVSWAVDGGAANGGITASGLYTAPAAVPAPAAVTIRATSQVDASRSGTAVVTVVTAGAAPADCVLVPAGSFVMGDGSEASTCGSSEMPVTLTESFYLGQTEVTNQQYLQLVQWAYDRGYVTATAYSVEDAMGSGETLIDLDDRDCELEFFWGEFRLRDARHGINPNHPVKQVTWYGAVAYCDWRNLKEGLTQAYDHETWLCNGGDPYRATGYRLPTEAEWEYAAQYDDERIYPWGDGSPGCDLANYGACGLGWTAPVGSRSAGPDKLIGGKGLFDMAGNVWEWCNDWHQCPAMPDAADPAGPAGSEDGRVVRGGSWNYGQIGYLRCANRGVSGPNGRTNNLGFRVARSVGS